MVIAVFPDVGFFEGTEKLLELSFFSTPCSKSLRTISRSHLEDLLDLVKCTIVGCSSNQTFDAYVLSESSLFVYDHRLILKTCGTTTLLPAIPRILEMARTLCDLTRICELFYSRKNFARPEEQAHPHSSFETEINFLDKFFGGCAYTLGRINGTSWHLYALECTPDHLPEAPPESGQTLELLMEGLDPKAAAVFYKSHSEDADRVTKETGLATIIGAGTKTDAVLFDPCGYSVNGMLGAFYFTVHVTPQPECSYASFETNAPLADCTLVVNRVLSIFRPALASLSLFAFPTAACGHADTAVDPEAITNYVRCEAHLMRFASADLHYAHFKCTDGRGTPKLGSPICR